MAKKGLSSNVAWPCMAIVPWILALSWGLDAKREASFDMMRQMMRQMRVATTWSDYIDLQAGHLG